MRDQDERAQAQGTDEQDDAFARAACQPADAQYPPDVYGHGEEYQAGQDRADSGQRDSEWFPGCDIRRRHGISRWWLTAAWAARPGLPGEVNARRTIPAQNLKNRWTVLADSILLPAPVAYRERISRGKIGNLSRISRDPRAAGAEGRGRAGGSGELTGSLAGYPPGDQPWLGGGRWLARHPPRDRRPLNPRQRPLRGLGLLPQLHLHPGLTWSHANVGMDEDGHEHWRSAEPCLDRP